MRGARRDHLADLDELLGDDAGDRRRGRWHRQGLFERGDLRVDHVDAARAASISSRAPGRSRAGASSAVLTRLRAASRDLATSASSPHRLAASRARVALEQRVEAVEVLLGADASSACAAATSARAVSICDCACRMSSTPRRPEAAAAAPRGRSLLGPRARSRAARRACRASAILALLHAIAFLHGQRQDAPADFGGRVSVAST